MRYMDVGMMNKNGFFSVYGRRMLGGKNVTPVHLMGKLFVWWNRENVVSLHLCSLPFFEGMMITIVDDMKSESQQHTLMQMANEQKIQL